MAISATAAVIRVVIGEDDVLMREGLVRLLTDSGLDVVGQAGDADDLLRKAQAFRPDVAIVDVRMPPHLEHDGLVAAVQLRRRLPETGVLILSQFYEPALALELIGDHPEGVGYLLKERVSNIEEFAAAVRRVAAGGSALDPTVVSQIVGRRRRDDPLAALTPREREVLEAMAEGRSNAAISQRLYLSESAVAKHTASIFGKLALAPSDDDNRRVLAVLAYLNSR